MKRRRKIVYWGFAIDIVGIQCQTKKEQQKVRKLLSRDVLREIEQAALHAIKQKLPSGFGVKLY